jgi:fructose-bisphosphate aldolase class I
MGALLRGRTAGEALDFAKANVENAVLNDTLELEDLERKVNGYRNRRRDLRLIAKVLMAPGKGILAADESEKSIHERFAKYEITDDQKHRRDYRNLLISMEDLDKYLNGIILFDETVRQKMLNGQNFVSYLTNHGIVGGIKVDKGLRPFPAEDIGEHKALPSDVWTDGLSDLLPRVKDYYQMGLRFAKWRSAFRIDASDFAIRKNAKDMARYAYICQEEGLVPIVEPELLFDGDYNINDSAIVISKILDEVFWALNKENVDLSACILKTSMVIGGKQREKSSPEEVGLRTAEVLREHVPEELAGVVFLSGGQEVEQATANLREITNHGPYPWPVTFSFARALQEPVLTAWKGQEENVAIAQQAFLDRLQENISALTKD